MLTRVPLTGGAYKARSIIAGAQRCVNLYPEVNEGESPSPMTHYPRAGLVSLSAPPVSGRGRGLYRSSQGQLFAAVGGALYRVASDWSHSKIGDIADLSSPVSMSDNGNDLLAVDGTAAGWSVHLSDDAFAGVSGGGFYGSTHVDVLDTFFTLTKPATSILYASGSLDLSFDPLDFAAKATYPDPVVTHIVSRGQIWLLGTTTSEVWYNAGDTPLPFNKMPDGMVEFGCAAAYSPAKQDNTIFWLAQDKNGGRIAMRGQAYQAQRISTHAIEAEWGGYSTVSDAVGSCYQIGGHAFYKLSFPTANKTWVWDNVTGLWHEEAWTDGDGNEHRARDVFHTFHNGKIVAQDWETGALYALSLDAYDDAGANVVYRRSFPHLTGDGRRLMFRQFIADMEVGRADAGQEPLLSLRWSDDRGASWGNPIADTLGRTGEYRTSINFQRLGYARDRVFELFWSSNVKTALNGAFIDVVQAAT